MGSSVEAREEEVRALRDLAQARGVGLVADVERVRGGSVGASGVEEVLSSEDDMSRMWAWFNRIGYSADIAGLRREFPDVPWKSFDDWLLGLAEGAQPTAP